MSNYEQVILNIENYLSKKGVAGATLTIFDSENIIKTRYFGIAEKIKKEKRSIDLNTKFMLGEMIKVVTAMAILKLSEEGKLKLSDDIKIYLPEFSINTRFLEEVITIEDLLNNRAGFPSKNYEFESGSGEVKIQEVMEYLKNEYLVAPVNMMESKSNVGYQLLGYIIERASDKKYEDYIFETIFAPLNILVNKVNSKEEYNSFKSSFAIVEGKDDKCYNVGKMPAAISNWFISTNDFLKIIQNFLKVENGLLKKETIDYLLKEASFLDDEEWNQKTWLGLEQKRYYLETLGRIVGYNNSIYQKSSFVLLPNEKIGALIFLNDINFKNSEDLAVELLKSELDISYQVEKKRKQITYVNCKIEDYAGYYPMYNKNVEVYLGDFLTMKIGEEIYKMQLKESGYFDLFKVQNRKFLSNIEKLEKYAKIKDGLLTIIDINDNSLKGETVAYFTKPAPLKDSWRKALGEYKEVNYKKNAAGVPDSMTLTVENNFLTMKIRGEKIDEKVLLVSINEQEAIVLGYGNNSNETVQLNLSNIKFRGVSFVKVKESPLNKVKEKKINQEKITKKNKQKKLDKMFDFEE